MNKEYLFYYIYNVMKRRMICINRYLVQQGICKKPMSIRRIRQYAGKKILDAPEYNKWVYDKIINKEPFMVCRFGYNELSVVVEYLQEEKKPITNRQYPTFGQLCSNAGFFPADQGLVSKYVEVMLKTCKEIDICGIWRLFMEDYVLKTYAQQAQITLLGYLEPWNMLLDNQDGILWTSALKGKKVLVVHPFAETIKSQYNHNRQNIFSKLCNAKDILPDFELNVIKAVQTINGQESDKYEDWFQALESMVEECRKIDFDVAIVGCGAYGMPLAAEIKKMGKGVVHLGGATQLLFGIKGRRWEEEYPEIAQKVMNESWVRPSLDEIPKNANMIENGCYW